MQSTKVDIVYYKIPTDYEMEFDLSGCCRMRLLTSSTYTRKDYIEGLSRAVSRSKIIISCGQLFGDEGLIYTTSRAIGKSLVINNNKEYGIVDDQNIKIIEDSVPLVTNSGIFGGLIIESGPQTLILLSENNAVRKSILKNLIHPYIQEVSLMELRGITRNSTPEKETLSESDTKDSPDITEESFAADTPEVILPPETLPEPEPSVPSAFDMAMERVAGDVDIIAERLKQFSVPEIPTDEDTLDFITEIPEEEPEKTGEEDSEIISKIDFMIDGDETEEIPESLPASETIDFAFDKTLDTTEPEESEPESEKPETAEPEVTEQTDHESETVQPEPQSPESSHSADSVFIESQIELTRTPVSVKVHQDKSSHPVFLFEDEQDAESEETDSDLPKEEEKEQTPENPRKKHHKSAKSLNSSIIIIALLLVVIIAALCYFVFYVPYSKGISTEEFFKEIFSSEAVTRIVR